MISVMRLVNNWLNNEHVMLAEDVLTEMRQFVIAINNSGYLDELVFEIARGIRREVCIHTLR
jgi:hypothetical protein